MEADGGRIVKTTGDGILVEFPSAVDAVRSALDIQEGVSGRSTDVPEGQRIAFRVGINVGDVIIEGDDIHGDGVNIAARLEALAEPGCVFVSRSVHEQVRGKLEVVFDDLGDQSVKNISVPIRVFHVHLNNDASSIERPSLIAESAPQSGTQQSIAVLPFENMSGDPEQEYFADGIAEDVITALSKISQLLVIARNSSFVYKGSAVNVQQVGLELGVSHVVQGSVRKAANRVRIAAQLIDCASGAHLWAERFDRELTDIFEVQDEVTSEIVSALALKLTPEEQQRLERKGTDNVEAYDYFLRAREQWWQMSKEGNARAKAMLTRAIELDPGYAAAYAILANANLMDQYELDTENEDPIGKALELSKRAIALDPSDPQARVNLGVSLLWTRDHERAISEAKAAVALDPNFAIGRFELGMILHYAGLQDEAIECVEYAMKLDPHYPDIWLHLLAQAHFQNEKYDSAIELLEERLARNPDSYVSRVLMAACFGHLGRTKEAGREWTTALRLNPNYSLEHRQRVLPYKDPRSFQRVVNGLSKAGLPK